MKQQNEKIRKWNGIFLFWNEWIKIKLLFISLIIICLETNILTAGFSMENHRRFSFKYSFLIHFGQDINILGVEI